MPGGGAAQPPLAVQPADFAAFEQLLQAVQAAWSNHDLTTLRGITTPEMASYFAEQLADQVSRGVRNVVSQVKLEQGDLSEAWAEGGREYATVAMRFSMTDVTVDATGRVVDGDPAEHVQATEIWTFLRAPGGRWVLSAIQQTR
jgi:predicted lipid-binding transport protein (Tim44 family)